MSQKVINKEDIDLIFVSTLSNGVDRLFIVYYVTTNDINFYRMNYPIDSILSERLVDSTFDVYQFLIKCIERRHDLHKRVNYEELKLELETTLIDTATYQKMINYQREIKINQII